ncbi:MAG: hypothetical protein JNJ71_20505 [Rubrivivax sp.]|nr:hypothetical protein [Rubrivivax sp.]
MTATQELPNPFELLINPESVIKAVESSERLGRLQSRVCRPLDRPLIPTAPNDALAAFDAAIERASARRAF